MGCTVIGQCIVLMSTWCARGGSCPFLLTNQNVARGEWPGRLVWKYKIVKHDPVDYWTCLPVCLRNQVLIMLPIMTVGPYFGLAFQAGTR